MEKSDLVNIIKAASQAPSGENAQPWRFEYRQGILNIYRLSHTSPEYEDLMLRGDMLSMGAILENIVIAAAHYGWSSEILYQPSSSSSSLVASVRFARANITTDLYGEIFTRCTNRKMYFDKSIDKAILNDLQKSINEDGVEIKFIDDKAELRKIAAITSYGESLFFASDWLRRFFLSNILFTRTNKKERGFVLDTLELPSIAEKIFSWCRNENIGKIFARIGLPRVVMTVFNIMFSRGPVIGVIVLDNQDNKSLLQAGRVMQRMWLKSTKYHLYLHPSCALIFLGYEASKRDLPHLSKEIRKTLLHKYVKLKLLFGINESREAVFLFRMGYADEPSAVSPKMVENILEYHE